MNTRRNTTVPVDGEVAYTIVSAIADREGVDEAALDPISDVVDPDALAALFPGDPSGAGLDRAELSFSYAGYDVTVRFGDEEIDLRKEVVAAE